jgi:hypothetical protein
VHGWRGDFVHGWADGSRRDTRWNLSKRVLGTRFETRRKIVFLLPSKVTRPSQAAAVYQSSHAPTAESSLGDAETSSHRACSHGGGGAWFVRSPMRRWIGSHTKAPRHKGTQRMAGAGERSGAWAFAGGGIASHGGRRGWFVLLRVAPSGARYGERCRTRMGSNHFGMPTSAESGFRKAPSF